MVQLSRFSNKGLDIAVKSDTATKGDIDISQAELSKALEVIKETEGPAVKELTQKAKTVPVTAQALKQHFLENAMPLLEQYIAAATGTGKLSSTNAGAREEVWSVLKQLLLSSSDKLELEITNAQDVVDAVAKGKCTFLEGKQLLDLYKKVVDIENPGKGANTQQTGLTINVLGGGQTEVQPAKVIEHIDE